MRESLRALSVSGAASVDRGSVGPAGGSNGRLQSALLAESVFDGVRSKMRRLQQDLAQREAAILALSQVRVGCWCGWGEYEVSEGGRGWMST